MNLCKMEARLKKFKIQQFNQNQLLLINKVSAHKFIYKQIPIHFQNYIHIRNSIQSNHLLNIQILNIIPNKTIILIYQYFLSNLQKQIQKRTSLSNKNPQYFYTQQQIINSAEPIINALLAFHKQNIIHGSLRSLNVIINQKQDIKLSDSFIMNQSLQYNSILKNSYYPPQYLQKKIVTYFGDYWALGLMLLQWITLISSQRFYDRELNKIKIEQIQESLNMIKDKSQWFIVGIRLLLQKQENVRIYGINTILKKKIDLDEKILMMIKKKNKIEQRSLKKRNTQYGIQRRLFRNDQQRLKVKVNEDSLIKKKQIQKINKIIQRSNAFVSELMAKKQANQKYKYLHEYEFIKVDENRKNQGKTDVQKWSQYQRPKQPARQLKKDIVDYGNIDIKLKVNNFKK